MTTGDAAALVDALRRGDEGSVDASLGYLEDDPWRLGSGYVKERLLRLLRRHELSAVQQRRLRGALVAGVDAGERLELREACRTARRFQDRELRDALVARLGSPDVGVVVRSARMVTALRHPRLTEADLRACRVALLAWADEGPRLPRWAVSLARRSATPGWTAELHELVRLDDATPLHEPVANAHGARLILTVLDR